MSDRKKKLASLAAMKALALAELEKAPAALTLSELVDAIGWANDAGTLLAVRGLVAEGRAIAGTETRRGRGPALARPGGRPYDVTVYSPAAGETGTGGAS